MPNAGGSGPRSILLRTTTCGRSSRPAPYAASSASIVRQRSSASPSDESMTCTSRRARSRCARNSWPRPTPSLAPSIRPGHVGDDELAPVGRLHRPEHRRERRERVLGDLRPRVRDAREERRLAGVREPDERGVGEELEAELDLPLLAREADLGEARRLPGRARRSACCRGRRCRPSRRRRARPACARSATSSSPSKTCVPTGTASTASSPRAPFERRPPPAPPRPGAQLLVRTHAGEVAPPRIGDEHDVAAVAAVAAVGPAARARTSPAGSGSSRRRRGRRRRSSRARSWNIGRTVGARIESGPRRGS